MCINYMHVVMPRVLQFSAFIGSMYDPRQRDSLYFTVHLKLLVYNTVYRVCVLMPTYTMYNICSMLPQGIMILLWNHDSLISRKPVAAPNALCLCAF